MNSCDSYPAADVFDFDQFIQSGAISRTPQKIAFLGDSTTHGTFQSDFIRYYLTTRFPGRNLAVYNCGIAGDTAAKALGRLDWDLSPIAPDLVLIMFGMNDVGRELYEKNTSEIDENTRLQRARLLIEYEENMRKLLDKLKSSGCEIVLITPTAFDQYGTADTPNMRSCNEGLSACANIVRKLSRNYNLPIVDLHKALTELFQSYPDGAFAGSDRTHPLEFTDWYISALILQGLQAPEIVSAVDIDFGSKTLNCRNCQISAIEYAEDMISFVMKPESFPMIATPAWKQMEEYTPIGARINRMPLRFNGLPSGQYQLQISGQTLVCADHESWASGIDIATLPTPWYDISGKMYKSNMEIRDIVQKMRSCDYGKQIMCVNGQNPNEPAAAEQFFPDFIAAHEEGFMKEHVRSVFANYCSYMPYYTQLKEEFENKQHLLFSAAKPQGCQIVLRKIN